MERDAIREHVKSAQGLLDHDTSSTDAQLSIAHSLVALAGLLDRLTRGGEEVDVRAHVSSGI